MYAILTQKDVEHIKEKNYMEGFLCSEMQDENYGKCSVRPSGEANSFTDYLLVGRAIKKSWLGVNVLRRPAGGLSDHCLVDKLRIVMKA